MCSPPPFVRLLCIGGAALAVWLVLAPPAGAVWRWPVQGDVLRAFAVRPAAPFAAGQHRGVDIAAVRGAAVRAACAGRVHFAGRVAQLGGVVSVRCGALVATYVELGSVAARRGARVLAGTRVGTVGAAGHVHLGARRGHRYVDPLTLLAAPPGPVLGPAPAPARPRTTTPTAVPPVPVTVPAARTRGVPAVAWMGLALVAAGLPVGGLLARRQRSRQRTAWTSSPGRRAAAGPRNEPAAPGFPGRAAAGGE